MSQTVRTVRFKDDARSRLLKGVEVVAEAVGSTMGAKGRNVMFETLGGLPKVTKDGVTVAKQIFLRDPVESMGAEAIKEAADKTVEDCGDSTTNTVVLASSIIRKAHQAVDKGGSPNELKRGAEQACIDVLESLKKNKVNIKKRDYYNIAKISANNDAELGKIISDAFKKAGKNGVVKHERSSTGNTYVETSNGMLVESGYSDKTMVTNPMSDTMELEKPYLLVCDKEIDNIKEIDFLFEFVYKTHENKHPLVIIGELDRSVVNILAANRIKHKLNVFYVKAPSFGSKRKDFLSDIALATGATLVEKNGMDNLSSLGTKILGVCNKVVSDKEKTIIDVDKDFVRDEIDIKIKELEKTITSYRGRHYKLQKEFLKDRIAKLSCAVSTIMVGANSEVELNEKIDRVDDAVNALKSAIEEGIVLGGGLALFNASYDVSVPESKSKDFNRGYRIILDSIRQPMRQILSNAEANVPEIMEEIGSMEKLTVGFNVDTMELCEFYKEGIIDPHKAIRSALENASSVALTFLLTDTTINITRENEDSIK